MANPNNTREESPNNIAANVIEINDLASLERLLLQKDIAAQQYVHWRNGDNPQEAYLRIESLNGKRTVSHYDINGRPIIMPMREQIEKTLGVKPIDISGLERVGAGLFNAGGFSADQPLIVGEENKREHALQMLTKIPTAQLEAMVAKTATATAAAEFAKGGNKLFGRLFSKQKTVASPEVAPEVKSTFKKDL